MCSYAPVRQVAKYREEAKRLSIDLAESNRGFTCVACCGCFLTSEVGSLAVPLTGRIRELEESESVVQSQLDDVVAQRAIAADRAAAVETDYEDERNLRLQAEQVSAFVASLNMTQ